MAKPPTILSWSSGKDSAWTLHVLRQQEEFDVRVLLTTFNTVADRVAMHAVRRDLVEKQALAAGLPLIQVPLPWPCSNADYELAVGQVLAEVSKKYGAEHVAFGDLFLEDIRAYREKRMQDLGLTPVFPLWERPTSELARDMVAGGLKANITCVDPEQLDRNFVGRRYDLDLIASLPETSDPCGENGEFHTFAWDGPMFREPIPVTVGEIVERDGFAFADLVNTVH